MRQLKAQRYNGAPDDNASGHILLSMGKISW